MTGGLGLAGETLAAGAYIDAHASGSDGHAPVGVGELVAPQEAGGVAHMPQFGARLNCHDNAVAGVLQSAIWNYIRLLQVILDHLLVVLETAGCQNDCPGAYELGRSIDLDFDTENVLSLRILNEVLAGRREPHVNQVAAFGNIVLEE